jgi:indole-3-glycerol phosphate synthase
MTILDKIVVNKRRETDILKAATSIKDLEKSRLFERKSISMSDYLIDKNRTGIIAEFKRKSPSLGIISPSSTVEHVTSGYFTGGASGVSILTDTRFFGGTNADIEGIREKSSFPILRKDFIVDEFQVIESKSIGADIILLIAAILGTKEVKHYSELAHSLGMEVLLEIHEADELEKITSDIDIIGVNNRDLKTFSVDIENSKSIAAKIPGNMLKISESGISSPGIVKELKESGFNGFLIGEKFMTAVDPVSAFTEFAKKLS